MTTGTQAGASVSEAEPTTGETTERHGPLKGITVVDVSTLGPGPFASMVLADFGADVIEICRPEAQEVDASSGFSRGKRKLIIDLRAPGGPDLIARLTDTADVFLESYRPGTMERRGLGPKVLLARNPRLIYTRLTGWGQSGPYALTAGHDINYVAIAGALGAVGTNDPTVALNLLGDIGAGSFPAVLGTVMALFARETTDRGQIVDAAMVDGAAYTLSAQFIELALGEWHGRGWSMLCGVAPFYTTYRCSDGEWVSVGAIESKFYRELVTRLGLDPSLVGTQHDRAEWPRVQTVLSSVFASKPRSYWAEVFRDSDCCVYPVLNLDEVETDPHASARDLVRSKSGQVHPAPRLSATPGHRSQPVVTTPADSFTLLRERGLSTKDIERYRSLGALHLDV